MIFEAIGWTWYQTKWLWPIISIVIAARILRGLRIAARLGLSLSKDTADAMHNLYSSVQGLAKVVAEI